MRHKKTVAKKETVEKVFSIEDPVNTDTWKCAVVMAVERTSSDSFVLKEFMEEASKGLRQEVKLINFETYVMKILNDFVSGELSYKHAYLLNFSSLFQEAAEFVRNKLEVPVPLLAKVIKVLLFSLREESLLKIERKASGPPDPIKAMAERPIGAENKPKQLSQKKVNSKKTKKQGAEGELKIRPPSATKEETKLLRRGEQVKEDQCIDDAPIDGYFNLYVLLTGFLIPEFPLELLKVGVPLHCLLCIDTSVSGMKRVTSTTQTQYHRTSVYTKNEDIQNFWESFLKILWNPESCMYFKDTIFQVYIPQRLLCEKKKLRAFIYKEISYLMYDLSDYKRQHLNYLKNTKLWDVSDEVKLPLEKSLFAELDFLPNECVTVPIILQSIIDVICGEDGTSLQNLGSVSYDSIESEETRSTSPPSQVTQSMRGGSYSVRPAWSQIVAQLPGTKYAEVYSKTKELDIKYDLDERYYFYSPVDRTFSEKDGFFREKYCRIEKKRIHAENMEEALRSENNGFQSYWRQLKPNYLANDPPFAILDYCLYALLLTKVICPYAARTSSQAQIPLPKSTKKSSNFELIENLETEMRKPHFTVTGGSRSILKSIPYNLKDTSKDFFSPYQLKVVTPEKLKASSAPEFHQSLKLIPEVSFISELPYPEDFFRNFEVDVYQNLRSFLKEDLFMNTENFDFVEELSKTKLLTRENQYMDEYNCVDRTFSLLLDSLLIVLHNRKDSDGFLHETFNQVLKTGVGLRDFFEYILEDESEWFKQQENLYRSHLEIKAKKSLQELPFKDFPDSYFWLDNCVKRQECIKWFPSFEESDDEELSKTTIQDEEPSNKEIRTDLAKDSNEILPGESEFTFSEFADLYNFEGYDVSETAVQYSGLKTVYYAKGGSVAVELIEKLYGHQNLGVHVNQGGHSLHLYSYVCPEPHLADPYMFHLMYKSGICLAFGERFAKIFEEVEEPFESKMSLNKNRKSSSETSRTITVKTRKISKEIKDEEFLYDMALTIPNGLSVATVRNVAKPCYVKQRYLANLMENSLFEKSRLFLPNGNIVKIMPDNTVEIFMPDTSVVRTTLDDVAATAPKSQKTNGQTEGKFSLANYTIVTPNGDLNTVTGKVVTSSKRLQIFQNTDVQSKITYIRRHDGTNYMHRNDGSTCVQFKDGTKILSKISVTENSPKSSSDSDESFDSDFVFVDIETIMEHPDYATVVFNTQTTNWTIHLPQNSAITVRPNGTYSVQIDKQTELEVEQETIRMSRSSPDDEFLCCATADLSVFADPQENNAYCRIVDSTGKTFVVEPNSNSYVLPNEELEGEEASLQDDKSSLKVSGTGNKLTKENKYFVVRKDTTGYEILENDSVKKTLTKLEKGSIVYTQQLPGTENLRCFVLITPITDPKYLLKKWKVSSLIPDPVFASNSAKVALPSTYGQPPSWMHPFPKKKMKCVIPSLFTCRVFIETKSTGLRPAIGTINRTFCEMDDVEIKHSKIEPGVQNVREYLKRLANDDQSILKEMYALTMKAIIEKKIKFIPGFSEKLDNYLNMSKYYVEMQEYHKYCIRYHVVPNYFQHPAGMSWLIINDLINKLPSSKIPCDAKHRRVSKAKRGSKPSSSPPSTVRSSSSATFSNEEIEYNLSVRSFQSFSDLSYRTGLSAKTAPAMLTTGGVCTCKIRDSRNTASAPIYQFEVERTFAEGTLETLDRGPCFFSTKELKELERPEIAETTFTLEDLMFLQLV